VKIYLQIGIAGYNHYGEICLRKIIVASEYEDDMEVENTPRGISGLVSCFSYGSKTGSAPVGENNINRK
jgi:hypothetical protein